MLAMSIFLDSSPAALRALGQSFNALPNIANCICLDISNFHGWKELQSLETKMDGYFKSGICNSIHLSIAFKVCQLEFHLISLLARGRCVLFELTENVL